MKNRKKFIWMGAGVCIKKLISVSLILSLLSALCCVQAFAQVYHKHNYDASCTLVLGETENITFKYSVSGQTKESDYYTVYILNENMVSMGNGTAMSVKYVSESYRNNVVCSVKALQTGSYRLKLALSVTALTPSTDVTVTYHDYVVTIVDRTFTVNFDANGGNVGTPSKSVDYKTVYGNLPVPTRAGYVFDGWYTEQTGGTQVTASSVFTAKEDQRLFAHWSRASYNVRFDTNGGDSTVNDKTVTFGSTYGVLETPTRTGYSFVGWFTDVTGGDRVYSDTNVMLSGNQTLYAHWLKNTYSVIFDPNGGTSSVYEKELAYGSKYGELPTPTRTHYDFNGWYTAAEGGSEVTALTTFDSTQSVTLYAQWTPKEYIVYFDTNGGTVEQEYQYVTYNAAYGSLPVPVRDGYSFDGWYTQAQYGLPITSDSIVDFSEEQVLYAHWTATATRVSGLTLDRSAVTLRPNETTTLTATVTPSDAINNAVNWQSSNAAVATVSDGVITAHSVGTTIVTAATVDGGYSAACIVTVKEPSGGDSSMSAGGLSFAVTFNGDTSVGTVYAALYSADGALNVVKQYVPDDTVYVTFDKGMTGALVKIMWLDENLSPLCATQTIPLQ